MEMNPFVLDLRNVSEWAEPLQTGPSALTVTNGPATVAPYSATSKCVAAENPIRILIISLM